MSQYVDVSDYDGTIIPEQNVKKHLKQASQHIDSLTYNRIVGRGFSNLTHFQQDIIQDTCVNLAEFEYENSDMINSVMQSYSINSVSMNFGTSWNVKIQNGVAIKRDLYEMLSQTGLCCLSLGV